MSSAQADHADGLIVRTTIDWGDGSPPLQAGGAPTLSRCPADGPGWPFPTRKMIADGDVVHHYPAPGTYTVTMTAMSTGCDGVSQPQTGTGTYV